MYTSGLDRCISRSDCFGQGIVDTQVVYLMLIGERRERGGKTARICVFAILKCPIKDRNFATMCSKSLIC